MKKIGDITANQSLLEPIDETPWKDEANMPINLKEEVFIKHIEGPLFFGSTAGFHQLAKQIPNTAKTVVIRMEKLTIWINQVFMPWKMSFLNLKNKILIFL